MNQTDLLIERNNIRNIKFAKTAINADALQQNQLLLKVDKFAFTANNITYAAMGEMMAYWSFFPADEAGWGKLPVWGFADVLVSAHPDIEHGERIFGYFPLSTHLVVDAGRVTSAGFVDTVAHRSKLPPFYNQYTRVANAPGFASEDENLIALLRPLYMTAFLLDDFVAEHDLFGTDAIVLSSASSKTGSGMAFFLAQNKQARRDYAIVGLTSAENTQFVTDLGYYDEVLAYGDVTLLDADRKTVYVDFSGNGSLRRTVHTHFGDALQFSSQVGISHWDKLGASKGLPGPEPTLFFAPAQAQKRVEQWGGAAFQSRTASAWSEYVASVGDWLNVSESQGEAAVADIYEAMLGGNSSASSGFMLSLWSA